VTQAGKVEDTQTQWGHFRKIIGTPRHADGDTNARCTFDDLSRSQRCGG
jgi:hypothetical protein